MVGMKKINRALVFLLLMEIVYFRFPVPFSQTYYGGYYYYLELAWCTSESSCLHETGHVRDDELRNISQTELYWETVEFVRQNDPVWREWINNYPKEGGYWGYDWHREIYAEMYYYMRSGVAEIPELLKLFY